jgi:hypothetical protein
MELRDFISESLVQIANGIEAANQQLASSTARVNPANVLPYEEKYSSGVYGHLMTGDDCRR